MVEAPAKVQQYQMISYVTSDMLTRRIAAQHLSSTGRSLQPLAKGTSEPMMQYIPHRTVQRCAASTKTLL